MKTQNRDLGHNLIKARKNHSCYGMGLGIIILDDVYPGFPGDVRNACTYPYNVQFEIVQDVDIQTLVFAEEKSPCLEPIIRAAKNLEKKGCRAISAECGYFAYFQSEISETVDIPVLMSSLLQVPLAQQIISPKKVVGLYVGAESALRDEHLIEMGIKLNSNYVVTGATDGGKCQEFQNLWIDGIRPNPPQAYYDKAEKEFVELGVDFFRQHPNMGAMVLECTGFPPFARALQREINIPLFSYSTLLDYAYSVVVHRDFYGHV
jgi:hypothetical protein